MKTIQSYGPGLGARAVERGRILGRRDPDRRRQDRFGAAILEHLDELAGLLARSGHDDPLAEQRPIVEPAQVLAQPDDRADDEQRRASSGIAAGDRPERALDGPLRRQGAVVDQRRGLVFVAAVRDERLRHRGDLPRPGVADQRAVQPRQRRPVDVGGVSVSAFVAADEDQHVARVRDR